MVVQLPPECHGSSGANRSHDFQNSESSSDSLSAESVKDYPLATAPMPHYLRQFSYVERDKFRWFDDALMAEMAPEGEQNRRRERLQRLGAQARLASFHKRRADGGLLPATKRPNNELPPPSAVPDTPTVTLAVNNEPLRDADDAYMPVDTLPSANDMRRDTLHRDTGESLLSPTASPGGSPLIFTTDQAVPSSNNDNRAINAHGNESVGLDGAGRLLHPSHLGTPDHLPLHDLLIQPNQQQISQVDQVSLRQASGFRPSQDTATFTRQRPYSTDTTTSSDVDESMERTAGCIASITDTFELLPQALHRYQLFSLFRMCSRNTLSAMYAELEAALRCDLLTLLPPELSDKVLGYLDASALCAASQVCKTWYRLIDGNENVWRFLLDKDGLSPTAEDLERAEDERWGYVGWTTPGQPNPIMQRNTLGGPINIFKAVYRRRTLIARNWMNPSIQPREYSILCPDREVITCLDLAEDNIIASTDGKKHINVYETATGKLVQSFADHEGGVWALKRVNNDTLVSGSVDHTVRVWSLSKGRCTHVLRGHTATVRCLDVVMPTQSIDPVTRRQTQSPQWPVIITGSRDATLRMWRLPGQNDVEFDNPGSGDCSDGDPYFIRALNGHTSSVRAVSGYGDVAVSGSYDHTVRVWKISTGECLHVLEGHTQNVYSAIIDPERNHCISASMDWHVNIWSLETGTLLHSLDGHTALVGLLGLCPPTLVSAAADKTLRIWDPASGELLHKLVGHENAITCFHHDSTRIVSGSEKQLKLWNARTGEFMRDLLSSMDHIWQVSFSHRRCVAAVSKGRSSFLEVLDFDVDPENRRVHEILDSSDVSSTNPQ